MTDINPITPALREEVNAAFDGFIGNSEAVHSIKRSLIVAKARTPVSMDKTFLMVGPPSTGKSELARRISRCLGLPLVALDGRAVKTREKLFEMIGEALAERGQEPVRNGDRGGVAVMEYPPFAVFCDEAHAISERAQQGFLTMLEKDDRSVMLDGQHMRRIAVVRGSTFVFATTRPAELDRALRTRCTEINLNRYTLDEVAGMVARRAPQLPAEIAHAIAKASRITPRIAFELADDVKEELFVSDDPKMANALARVMLGRGILTKSGLTRNDVRYLQLLDKEKRALGETVIAAMLSDIDRQVIADDVEPYLVRMDMMRVTERGRAITAAGKRIVEEFKE